MSLRPKKTATEKEAKPAHLGLRAEPKQGRSQAMMEHLLAVSAELLDELGLEAFNTNLLAQRAGVSTRAIYRYFPNKFAILVKMAEHMRALEMEWMGDFRALDALPDWREAVGRAVEGYYHGARRQRGYVALRAASRAVPELRDWDDRMGLELAGDLAQGLAAAGVALDAVRLSVLSRTILESASRIQDIALMSPEAEAALFLAELKRMIVNLLADYLDPGPPSTMP
jgi:AcrR family transcriptional regulator